MIGCWHLALFVIAFVWTLVTHWALTVRQIESLTGEQILIVVLFAGIMWAFYRDPSSGDRSL